MGYGHGAYGQQPYGHGTPATPLGDVTYTERARPLVLTSQVIDPPLTVTYIERPRPLALGYTPIPSPIAVGYTPRPPSED